VVGRGRKNKQTRGVSHCSLTIYILKNYIKEKEELREFKYVT